MSHVFSGGGGGLLGAIAGIGLGMATGGLGFGLTAAEMGAGGGALGGLAGGGGLQGAIMGGLGGYGMGGLSDLAGLTGVGTAGADAFTSGAFGSTGLDAGISSLGSAFNVADLGIAAGGFMDSGLFSAGAGFDLAGIGGQSLLGDPSLINMAMGSDNSMMDYFKRLNPFSQTTDQGQQGKMGPLSKALGLGSAGMSMYNSYQMQQLAKQMQNPYTGQYQQQLAQLMSNPGSYMNTPSYQFQYGQGLQAMQRQMASQGFGGTGADPGRGGGSGNFAAAAQRYGQGMAQTGINQQAQLLSGLQSVNPASIQAMQAANQSNMSGLYGLGMGMQMMGL